MSRYQTPYLQYFDAAGKPLAGGKLFFYEAGTNDLKTVFTDIDQTIPATNPVTLNANGSVSNIFYSGLARVVLQNATGTQIFDIDDVGPEDLSGLPPLYVSDATYSLNDVVKTADGLYYRSIQNGNAGNVPSPSSEYWEKIDFLYTYNANNSYQLDDVVKFGGQLYISTITANQGNSPATSNNWRKLTTLAEFEYLDGGLTLNKVNYPVGTKAHVKSFGSVTGGRNSYWVKQAVSGPATKLPSERLDLQCTDAIGAVWALQHGGVVYISSIGGNQNADNGLVFQAYDNKADILDLEGKEWPCTSLSTDSGSQREVLNSKVTNGRLIVTNSLGGETLVQTFSRHLDAEAQLSETKSPVIDWEGLNVLWLGTSIPHQGAGVDGYPERLGEALNFNAQNYAWSGSHAFYDIDGDAFDNATVRALTMTEVDRQAGLALYGPTSAYDDSFDLVTKPSQMTCDYRIKRQFETSPVDVVVLDHNHNDRKNIKDYTPNIKTIGSVTLGALTTFDLTDVSGLNVGDGCYIRVDGIDNLDYAAGRITAISGNDVTVGIDSTGFAGTFTSGELHWVDRTTIKGAWDFLIAYTKNMGIQFGKEDVKIILCGAPSYFTNNVDRDHSIWSVNRAIREIAQDWDLSFFDVAHALRLTYHDHLTYLPDAVHPSTPETREIFTNVWAKWLRGGAGNFYNPQSVLQRNKTIDNEHDQPALYSKYDSAYAPRDVTYKEQDPLIDEDFSGGLGDWTQLGTGTPVVVSAPWGGGDAVQFSVLAANTAPYLRQDVAVGETPVLEFDFYLPSVDLATGTTQQLTIASISGAGGAGYSVTVTQTAGSEAQVRGTYNQGGFGLSPVVSFPNSAFTIEAATKYRARIDIVDGYAQFSIDGQVMFSGAIDNDLIGAATTILVGPTFTNMGSDFEVFIGNVVAQAKESLHVMTTAELQKTVQSYTLAELQAMNPTLTGRRVICSDRSDAPLELAPSGYVALPGDITAANGRVWSLKIDGVALSGWFNDLPDAISRSRNLLATEDYTVSDVQPIDCTNEPFCLDLGGHTLTSDNEGIFSAFGGLLYEKSVSSHTANTITISSSNELVDYLSDNIDDRPILKIVSDDAIDINESANERRGEFARVVSVAGGVITLESDLYFTYTTSPRVAALVSEKFTLKNGTLDVSDLGTVRGTQLFATKLKMPLIHNLKITKGNDAGIVVRSCYKSVISIPSIHNLKDDAGGGFFGYGVDDSSSYCTLVINGDFSNTRHAYTTNTTSSVAGGDMEGFGPTMYSRVVDCFCQGNSDDAFDTHPNAYFTTFEGCKGVSNGNGLIKDRGKFTRVINPISDGDRYGVIASVNSDNMVVINPIIRNCQVIPLFFNPSTSADFFVDGGEVHRSIGNELIRCVNTTLRGGVTAKYDGDTSASKVFRLENSSILMDDVSVDFRGSSSSSLRIFDIVTGGNNVIDVKKVSVLSEAGANIEAVNDATGEGTNIARIRSLESDELIRLSTEVLGAGSFYRPSYLSGGRNIFFTLASNDQLIPELVYNGWEEISLFLSVSGSSKNIIALPDGAFAGQYLKITLTKNSPFNATLRHGASFNTDLISGANVTLIKGGSISLVWNGTSWEEFSQAN